MAEYLRYIFKNQEPLRIADDAARQSGQAKTLSFVPGSTLRGLAINSLAESSDFNEIKKVLFSDSLIFMNALLTTKEHTLIPSPKGFYEDKRIEEGKKQIQNVVIDGSFSDGCKRAGLGKYCYMEDQCIHYYNVHMGSDMKILINTDSERKVFRSGYLSSGQFFEGYIRLSGVEKLDQRIREIFAADKVLLLGNARTSGMGKCTIIHSEITHTIPYMTECTDQVGDAYMMFLSDTAFRNGLGEISGLNPSDQDFIHDMEELLGVKELTIPFASTSIRTIYGYNRKWGARLPSMPAYEAGSVLHLQFHGTLSSEKIKELCDQGIGIRKNEGFGRILFLPDYESIQYKLPENWCWTSAGDPETKAANLTEDERETLRIAAKSCYLQKLEDAALQYAFFTPLHKEGAGNNQIASLEEILLTYQYQPLKAEEKINQFFQHAAEKEANQRIQRHRCSASSLQEQFTHILQSPIEETLFSGTNVQPFRKKGSVMGIPVRDFFSKEDEARYKIRLLIHMIRQDRKGAAQ